VAPDGTGSLLARAAGGVVASAGVAPTTRRRREPRLP